MRQSLRDVSHAQPALRFVWSCPMAEVLTDGKWWSLRFSTEGLMSSTRYCRRLAGHSSRYPRLAIANG